MPPGTNLSKIPLIPHPDGHPSNLINMINPTLKTTTVFAVGIAMIIISTLCLTVRLITNLHYIKRLKIDDSTVHFMTRILTGIESANQYSVS